MLAADPWRLEEKRQKWSFSKQTKSNAEVFSKCKVIFLCVKPQVFDNALEGCDGSGDQARVSIAIYVLRYLNKSRNFEKGI